MMGDRELVVKWLMAATLPGYQFDVNEAACAAALALCFMSGKGAEGIAVSAATIRATGKHLSFIDPVRPS